MDQTPSLLFGDDPKHRGHESIDPAPSDPYYTPIGSVYVPFDNRITLHPRRTDAWGVPIPRIRLAITDNERALMRAQVQGLSREQSRWSVPVSIRRGASPTAAALS